MIKHLFKIFFIFISISKLIYLYPIPDPSKFIPESCKKNCSFDVIFGIEIGINNNVISYSNCDDHCADDTRVDQPVIFPKGETSFKKDVDTGLRWQCVEYSRRWLVINKHSTYGDVRCATDIFDLKIAENLDNEKKYVFQSIPNGSPIPPTLGDLIIFPKNSLAPCGHVAVITSVNLDLGFIEIAEQNYNGRWKEPNSYSRRLVILNCLKQYTITQINWREDFFDVNSPIINNLCSSEVEKVIGYKRVTKEVIITTNLK